MLIQSQNYAFQFWGGSKSSFTISYAIDQFLIIENGCNLVRAILFVLDSGLYPHSYSAKSVGFNHSEEAVALMNFPKGLEPAIERKLLEEGIPIISTSIVHNNRLYIPYACPLHGSDPDLMPEDQNEKCAWSLHILE